MNTTYPTVTMAGSEVELTMFPDCTDGNTWAVTLREGDDSVFLGITHNYEACLEMMNTFMVAFAALGYKLDSNLGETNAK